MPTDQEIAVQTAIINSTALAAARAATLQPDNRLTLRVLVEAIRLVAVSADVPVAELDAIIHEGLRGKPVTPPARPRIVRIH